MGKVLQKWYMLCLLALVLAIPAGAQTKDDLQEYLDQLAAKQSQVSEVKSLAAAGTTTIDLSSYSATTRTSSLKIAASLKIRFTNGTLSRDESFTTGPLVDCLGYAELGETANIISNYVGYANVLVEKGGTFVVDGGKMMTRTVSGYRSYNATVNSGGTFTFNSGYMNEGVETYGTVTYNGTNSYDGEIFNYVSEGNYLTNYGLFMTYNHLCYNSYVSLTSALKYKMKLQLDGKCYYDGSIIMKGSGYTLTSNDLSCLDVFCASDLPSITSQYSVVLDATNNCIRLQKSTVSPQPLVERMNVVTANIEKLLEKYYELEKLLYEMKSLFSSDQYFTHKLDDAVTAEFNKFSAELDVIADQIKQLSSIKVVIPSSLTQAQYDELDAQIADIEKNVDDVWNEELTLEKDISSYQATVDALPYIFPDEEKQWRIALPESDGQNPEVQMGYKESNGFVLTSSGIMKFQQVEGRTFKLCDTKNNWIWVNGNSLYSVTDAADATVFTGESLGNGLYSFYNNGGVYLSAQGMKYDTAIKSLSQDYKRWTITESTLDDLQAFLNELAESAEPDDATVTVETDTTEVVPEGDGEVIPVGIGGGVNIEPENDTPITFPRSPKPYVIRCGTPDFIGGFRRPVNWAPERPVVHIKKGTHVIFRDIHIDGRGGNGDVFMTIEGTLIIDINFRIRNMDGYKHVFHIKPGGRIIWRHHHFDGDHRPRIKNEGKFEMDDDDAYVYDLENHDKLYHRRGTIHIIRNYHYYDIYGTVKRIYNHEGGETYIRPGAIICGEASQDTLISNWGNIHIYGGNFSGFGDHPFVHHKGEMHFYPGVVIPGNIWAYDDVWMPGSIRPNGWWLKPGARIHITDTWTKIWDLHFIADNNRPAPRKPLFVFDNRNHIPAGWRTYINWTLPNHRWRWYIDEVNNTIEPRDEKVDDYDDLQAYLDWLSEDPDGEASAGTEADPIDVDGDNSEINIPESAAYPMVIPAKRYVHIHNITFVFPSHPYPFFDIHGHVVFGDGFRCRGFYDNTITPDDDHLPRPYYRMYDEGRIVLGGGVFDDVIIRLVSTTINVYISHSLSKLTYFYVPSAYLTEGRRIIAPKDGYKMTDDDLRYIKICNPGWYCDRDAQGYGILTKTMPSGIDEISADDISDDTPVYNLTGARVKKSNVKAGIYVVGGKKMIVK